MNSVDIVLTWVDGGDPEWLKSRSTYLEKGLSSDELERMATQYRDWDNLEYVFRGIEKFMPWVRKIHFVTNGQKPKWLNEKHEKLNWVLHDEFIPAEYLPTFSSHVIELNMHRIKGLSEQFIYFNDDLYITRPAKYTDFFSKKSNLPKDQATLYRIPGSSYNDMFGHIQLNDIGVINQNFKKTDVYKEQWRKLFSLRNGLAPVLMSLSYVITNHLPGFLVNHMPQPYLKSVLSEVWSRESAILDKTCRNKFRTPLDVNQYVFREWQIVTGRFEPTNLMKNTKYFSVFPAQTPSLVHALSSQRYRMICINDVEVGLFAETKAEINQALDNMLPEASLYEI